MISACCTRCQRNWLLRRKGLSPIMEHTRQLAGAPHPCACVPDPKPGTDEAVSAGCLCGADAANRDDGSRFGWWVMCDCPLHGNGQGEMA